MEIASTVIQHISDKKSALSVNLETQPTDIAIHTITWKEKWVPRTSSFLFISLLVYWILTEQNGFSSETPSMVNPAVNATANGYLGYHALGLALWSVFFCQESIMSYAAPMCAFSYNTRRIIHIASQIVGMVCGIGGMTAILWYKSSLVSMPVSGTYFTLMEHEFYVPYSPHAWIGVSFIMTWLIQCIGRLFPQRFTLERHRFLGRVMYVAGLGCCALGLQQQQTRQLMVTINAIQHNMTITSHSSWWFSQPSLGVLLLGITGAVTFYLGLL
jgi:hypothetical protein